MYCSSILTQLLVNINHINKLIKIDHFYHLYHKRNLHTLILKTQYSKKYPILSFPHKLQFLNNHINFFSFKMRWNYYYFCCYFIKDNLSSYVNRTTSHCVKFFFLNFVFLFQDCIFLFKNPCILTTDTPLGLCPLIISSFIYNL